MNKRQRKKQRKKAFLKNMAISIEYSQEMFRQKIERKALDELFMGGSVFEEVTIKGPKHFKTTVFG